jgi:AraC-like DNA-binding protein
MALATQGHYFERDEAASPSPCLLTAVRYVRNDSGSAVSAHLLYGRWVVDYSISDCGRCKAGAESEPWLPRTPGIAHLYPPGTKYWEDARDRPLPLVSAYIIFRGGARAGLGKFVQARPGFGRFYDVAGRIGDVLQEMAAIGSLRGDASLWQEQALLFTLFDHLHAAVPLPGGASYEWTFPTVGSDDENAKFLRQVQAILSKRLGQGIALAEIASRLRVSPSTLSHRYRRLAGEGPMQTLARLRVGTAKGLLLKGETIKNVAARTGFHDEFHFSKAFKRATGLPPSEYRKAGNLPPS